MWIISSCLAKKKSKSFTYNICTKYKHLTPATLKYCNWRWSWDTVDTVNWGVLWTGKGIESEAKSTWRGEKRGVKLKKTVINQQRWREREKNAAFLLWRFGCTACVCCLSKAFCSLLVCFVTVAYFSISASKSCTCPFCSPNPPSHSLTSPHTQPQWALRSLVFFQWPHSSKRQLTPPFKY